MSQAITIQAVQSQLTTLAPEIAKTLPPGMTPERFNRVALTAIQNTPALLQCVPQSLFNACMKAAQDGLLPDGREGAIIPRKGQATWQPMVHGIIKKAKNSGSVASLVANVVYKGEVFEVELGDEERIIHRRDLSMVKRGAEVAVYAIATLKDGTKEREIMSWQQVMDVRAMSTTPNGGPWATSTDEMARKTVIRRLSKRLPSLDDGDDELRQAIERVDSEYDFGKKRDPEAFEAQAEVVPPSPEPPPRPKWMAIADAFAAVVTEQDYYETLDREGERIAWLKVNKPDAFAVVDAARQAASERMTETPVAEAPAALESEEVP